MYVISTVFKPSRTGGKYLCNVRDVENNTVIDVTLAIAEHFALKYKDNVIQISHGSGTGFNVLKQLLIEGTGVKHHHVVDVSVF